MKTIWGREVFDTMEEMARPSHTALLVIDMQNDFAHKEGAFASLGQNISGVRAAIPQIRRLLGGARASGVLVVHVQQTTLENGRSDSPAWSSFKVNAMSGKRMGEDSPAWAGSKTREVENPAYCMRGSWGHQVVEELRPVSGEVVVHKYRSSGFTHTNLDHILRNSGIKSVVCCGCTTEGCVESTVRDASFHDYYPLVASDAAGAYSQDFHNASLLVMRSRYPVSEVDRYLALWRIDEG